MYFTNSNNYYVFIPANNCWMSTKFVYLQQQKHIISASFLDMFDIFTTQFTAAEIET